MAANSEAASYQAAEELPLTLRPGSGRTEVALSSLILFPFMLSEPVLSEIEGSKHGIPFFSNLLEDITEACGFARERCSLGESLRWKYL